LIGAVDLDRFDIEGIVTWLADVEKENRPSGIRGFIQQYTIDPPVCWHTAEDGTRLYRRFNCVGFVLDCYRSIDINLVDDTSKDNLPEVSLETIESAYGRSVTTETIRGRMGISGEGPWRIVLAGYVFHSLSRANSEIRDSPHIPKSDGERDFPIAQIPSDKSA